MRVRMLKSHESPASHPEHGPLTLVFGAGTTQHFDDATAAALIKNGVAEDLPEESQRVRMTRTMTEAEIVDRLSAIAARSGVTIAITPGSPALRFPKGALVHFNNATAAALLDSTDGGPYAVAEPDPDHDPIGATTAAATEDAIARKREQLAADERRAKLKEQTAAAVAKVKAKPSAPAPVAASLAAFVAPTAPASSGSTSSEG